MPRSTMPGLVRIHALLASFFLPVGIMFLVTGALYTVEIKGNYHTANHTMLLKAPLTPDLDALAMLTAAHLEEEGIGKPSGGMRIQKVGTSYAFEWTGSNRDVIVAPTENPLEARVEIKDTTWHRRFVQLHKAKGGAPFKAFAVSLAAGLLVLFLSGSILAWKDRKLRRQAVAAGILGAAAFAMVTSMS